MEGFFWSQAALVLYAYAGYPLILWLVTRIVGTHTPFADRPGPAPFSCSVMLPAHNEESVLEARLCNLLALEPPEGGVQVVVGSDASTDRTADIAREYARSGVVLVASSERRGKTALLNEMVGRATGDIIVFTDANCAYDQDALTWLLAPLADPTVGCVIGELHFLNHEDPTVSGGEGLYWRFENAIKEMESRLGGTLVANGSIYALRRTLYRPLPAAISDDSVNPLLVLRDGHKVVFERRAVAREKAAERLGEEFQRKARMVTRQLGSHFHVRSFLWPPRPLLAFRLVSHKLLRWLVPVFFLAALGANLFLLDRNLYRLTLAVALLGGVAAAAGAWRLSHGRQISRGLHVWVYFWMVNAAALKGLADFVLGRRRAVWRVSESSR